jgi:hypothetical protein
VSVCVRNVCYLVQCFHHSNVLTYAHTGLAAAGVPATGLRDVRVALWHALHLVGGERRVCCSHCTHSHTHATPPPLFRYSAARHVSTRQCHRTFSPTTVGGGGDWSPLCACLCACAHTPRLLAAARAAGSDVSAGVNGAYNNFKLGVKVCMWCVGVCAYSHAQYRAGQPHVEQRRQGVC